MRLCNVKGCIRKHSAKGYCNIHYLRERNGTGLSWKPKTPNERIFSRTIFIPETECLLWTGAKTGGNKGKDYSKYGYIRINKSSKRVHRALYELNNGPIPKGMVIMHTCDNPTCVNLLHLRLSTQKENIRDMFRKKRNRNQHSKGDGYAKRKKR